MFTSAILKPHSACLLVLMGAALLTIPRSSASMHRSEETTDSDKDSTTPPGSTFTLPLPNACQSIYDRFYEGEPGVYAYWALCEKSSPSQNYDYVGPFDLTKANDSWGSSSVFGVDGPVLDNEAAAAVDNASSFIENQGMVLNKHHGTVSAWIKADAPGYPLTAVFIGAVQGPSLVSLGVNGDKTLCIAATLDIPTQRPLTVEHCGYSTTRWHRAVLTWSDQVFRLYVDGRQVEQAPSTGGLGSQVYYYRLFPGCCNRRTRMALAKISISNRTWTSDQVMADLQPTFPPIPVGGVYVTSKALGTIHKDILGYADMNQDISTHSTTAALLMGLQTGGFTSLRYAGGYGGTDADRADWRGGESCGQSRGTEPAANLPTLNSLDSYLARIAMPLQLDTVYTVNYGTNPPRCDAGGSPVDNGASLVRYANITRQYGVKYWEIGNEVFSASSEADFHEEPHTGVSYAAFEPEFYNAMKAVDPTIRIGVPVGLIISSYQDGFDFPVLAGAKYDAVVLHNYPMPNPINDGSMLYQDRVAATISRTRGALLKLQTELLDNNVSPESIWITEWNAEGPGSKWSRQTLGAAVPLFVATQLAEYMRAGVRLATWWTQSKPNGCSTFNYDPSGDSAYGWWRCGSTALVYTGPTANSGEIFTGLKPGDVLPAGRAFQLLSESGIVSEGEHTLATDSDVENAPWLLSYGATHGSSYAVILINRDRDETHTVPVRFEAISAGTSAQQWSYGREQYDQSRSGDWSVAPVSKTLGPWRKVFWATLPPWSVNVFVFH